MCELWSKPAGFAGDSACLNDGTTCSLTASSYWCYSKNAATQEADTIGVVAASVTAVGASATAASSTSNSILGLVATMFVMSVFAFGMYAYTTFRGYQPVAKQLLAEHKNMVVGAGDSGDGVEGKELAGMKPV